MTQAELGLAVNASRSAVNAWENHRTVPRNKIGKVEEVLGVTLDEAPPADHRGDLLAQLRDIIDEAGEAGGDTTGRGRT